MFRGPCGLRVAFSLAGWFCEAARDCWPGNTAAMNTTTAQATNTAASRFVNVEAKSFGRSFWFDYKNLQMPEPHTPHVAQIADRSREMLRLSQAIQRPHSLRVIEGINKSPEIKARWVFRTTTEVTSVTRALQNGTTGVGKFCNGAGRLFRVTEELAGAIAAISGLMKPF